MKELLIVFAGGGIGSVVRLVLGRAIGTLHQHEFPWGTLVVNITACFVLGWVVGLADQRQMMSASARIFWTIGFCGGFSTFSTFSMETITLLNGGTPLPAVAYILLSVVLCLGATFGGLYLGK